MTDPDLVDKLTCDGLSVFDLNNMTGIIRNDLGDWYHAKLMRALHILMPHADERNLAILETAYPGSCLAYRLWYNGKLEEVEIV